MIKGERPQHRSIICSAARASHYLHQGFLCYVSYVMDTWHNCKGTVDDVSIMLEYSDVFPEDFPGVPPER